MQGLKCLKCPLYSHCYVPAVFVLLTLNCLLTVVHEQRRKEVLHCQVRVFSTGHVEWKDAGLEHTSFPYFVRAEANGLASLLVYHIHHRWWACGTLLRRVG